MSDNKPDFGSLIHDRGDPSFRSVVVSAFGWRDDEALLQCATNELDRTRRELFAPKGPALRATEESSSISRFTWKVWWEPPHCWRDEFATSGSPPDVALVTERNSMLFVAAQNTLYSNEPIDARHAVSWEAPLVGIVELPTIAARRRLFPLFGSAFRADEWTFSPSSTVIRNGSTTLRSFRALRRPDFAPEAPVEPSGYWVGVNEYECVFDQKSDIMHRLTAIATGREIATIEIAELAVDRSLPPDVFVFEGVPETRYRTVVRSR